jgi:hypothetical protein
MKMQTDKMLILPGTALLLLLAFASTPALAETDRITVEDPATSAVKFKVTSDGNVTAGNVTAGKIGINASSQTSQIEVGADGGLNSELRLRVASTSAGAPYFYGSRAGGSLATPTPTPVGKALFALGGTGYTPSGWTSALSGLIGFYTTENWTDSSTGTEIRFSTTTKGSATRAEQVRITDNGNVGLGTIAPTQKLEVSGGVRINTVTTKPACDSTARGTFWFTQGGAGVKDSAEVCAKDATDVLAWRPVW